LFRIGLLPAMYLGYPQFTYDGFSVLLVDPFPESWAYDWWADDDVYVDYDNGYYLCNQHHPGVRLAVMIEVPI